VIDVPPQGEGYLCRAWELIERVGGGQRNGMFPAKVLAENMSAEITMFDTLSLAVEDYPAAYKRCHW